MDQVAAATERRLLPWASAKKLARLAAIRGVIFASRAWLAEFLAVSERTVARLIEDLRRERVFVVLAARGAGGGTVMVPAWGQELDEAEAARAILGQLGQAVEAPDRAGAFKTVATVLRRMASDVLPERAIEILRRVARRAGQMCHGGQIDPDTTSNTRPTPSSTDAKTAGSASTSQTQTEARTPQEEACQDGAKPSGVASMVAELKRKLTSMTNLRSSPTPAPRQTVQASDDKAAILASARRLGIPLRERPEPAPSTLEGLGRQGKGRPKPPP